MRLTTSAGSAGVCSVDSRVASLDGQGSCELDALSTADGSTTATQSFQVPLALPLVGLSSSTPHAPSGTTVTLTASVDPSLRDDGSLELTDHGEPVSTTQTIDASGRAVRTIAPTDGAHRSRALFVPARPSQWYQATSLPTMTVTGPYSTRLTLATSATAIDVRVADLDVPSTAPTGTVRVSVDGSPHTIDLARGSAVLDLAMSASRVHTIAGTYAGSATFAAASGRYVRRPPTITRTITSSDRPVGGNWVNAPVVISYHCTTTGSRLAPSCPVPQTVTRRGRTRLPGTRIVAADGSAAETSPVWISIDRTAPRIRMLGLTKSGTHRRGTALRCAATDTASGAAGCHVTVSGHGRHRSFRAVALDRVGNRAVAIGRFVS